MNDADRAWTDLVDHARGCSDCGVILIDLDPAQMPDTERFCEQGRKLFWSAVKADLEARAK